MLASFSHCGEGGNGGGAKEMQINSGQGNYDGHKIVE